MQIEAIVFDKDGTLFDFQSTWVPPFEQLLAQIDADRQAEAADVMGFDLAERRFRPDSVVIAETTGVVAKVVAPFFGGDQDRAVERLNAMGSLARQRPAVELRPCLSSLRTRWHLGLVTNDSEAPARRHLQAQGVLDLFVFVAGYDSGYGAKPGPGQLLAFADATGIAPEATLMVGDSRHDLEAGRAAGMGTVGVLTGVAGHRELSDLADVILPDIGHLAQWLERAG